MVNYYLNLNAQSNGDHEVHKESCYYYYMFKSGYNFELLGSFSNEMEAVRYARMKIQLLGLMDVHIVALLLIQDNIYSL